MNKATLLKHLQAGVTAAKQYAAGLVSSIATSVTEALKEMESVKADKTNNISITIPTTGWKSDSNANYPKYYDIAVTGLTEKDCADIIISVNSLDTAIACGMCPTTETIAGKIRIRAAKLPTESISAQYRIGQGKE